jgi:glycosyltransferase involved in cell wall biosynthesis
MKKRHMLALGFATRFADRVCCNSIAVAEALKRVKADAGKEISIIPNGIEILPVSDTRGLRDSLGISPDEFVFICVSRLRREKGHATLLDAAAKLKDYDKELKILMAGDGPEQKNLERQAERLGITGMLKFCGHRDDVRELLAIADAAIFLSENEGFSNAVLEAMAAAKAVIATDIEGNSETIENGVDGLLVPAGNPEATAAAMNKMMDDGTLREALGNRAKEKVKSEFSVRREIDSYLEIYERLSGKSKGAEK